MSGFDDIVPSVTEALRDYSQKPVCSCAIKPLEETLRANHPPFMREHDRPGCKIHAEAACLPGISHAKFNQDDPPVIWLELKNGCALRVPLSWYPVLNGATAVQLGEWIIDPPSLVIKWPKLKFALTLHEILATSDPLSTRAICHYAESRADEAWYKLNLTHMREQVAAEWCLDINQFDEQFSAGLRNGTIDETSLVQSYLSFSALRDVWEPDEP